MSTISAFPTLIYRCPLKLGARSNSPSIAALNKDIAREARITRDIDDEGRAWSAESYVGGYTSYATANDLHLRYSTFADLRQAIDKHVQKFAQAQGWDLEGGRLKMTTCWINIMQERVAHGLHLHPLSVVSGTYYAQMPAKSGCIKFEDPRLSSMMAAPRRKSPSHLSLPTKAGDLVLFESWLRHEVPASTFKGERISVSFNYDWAR